eukprot:m.309374 g.309374  ORF g.309374 m.309374 type:complete len:272 (+) comp46263_c0_seq1:2-817(+)
MSSLLSPSPSVASSTAPPPRDIEKWFVLEGLALEGSVNCSMWNNTTIVEELQRYILDVLTDDLKCSNNCMPTSKDVLRLNKFTCSGSRVTYNGTFNVSSSAHLDASQLVKSIFDNVFMANKNLTFGNVSFSFEFSVHCEKGCDTPPTPTPTRPQETKGPGDDEPVLSVDRIIIIAACAGVFGLLCIVCITWYCVSVAGKRNTEEKDKAKTFWDNTRDFKNPSPKQKPKAKKDRDYDDLKPGKQKSNPNKSKQSLAPGQGSGTEMWAWPSVK